VNVVLILGAGDKESYWIGWELAGDEDYAFHEGELAVTGTFLQGPQDKAETESKDDTRADTRPDTNPGPAIPQGHTIVKTVGHGYNHRSTSIFEDNVTICAPQILHLDRDGAPLWLNGWILTDKYEKNNQTLVDFRHYMPEPTVLTSPGSWSIGEHNMACLTARQTFDFTIAEMEILDQTIQTALEVGSYAPGEAPLPNSVVKRMPT
jgi:alpha 1,3-mannosyltransferase